METLFLIVLGIPILIAVLVIAAMCLFIPAALGIPAIFLGMMIDPTLGTLFGIGVGIIHFVGMTIFYER